LTSPPPAPHGSAPPIRRIRAILFLAVLSLSLFLQTGDFATTDTIWRWHVAHGLWTGTPLVPERVYPGFGLKAPDGKIHAWYGIGQSLLIIPADMIAFAARPASLLDDASFYIHALKVSALLFPLIGALAASVAFELLLLLGSRPRDALGGTLLLVLCTTFFHYLQTDQENCWLFLVTAGALVCWLKWESSGRIRWMAALGALAGMAMLTRLTCAFEMLVVCAFAVLRLLRANAPRNLPSLARHSAAALLAFAPFAAAERCYQFARFGNWTGTYMDLLPQAFRALDPALPAEFPYTTPFLEGLAGPLFSPDKSILLFEPLLWTVLVLVAAKGRRFLPRALAPLATAAAIGFFAQAAFYARWYTWPGESAWGDRFLTVPLQLGMLAVGSACSALLAQGRPKSARFAVLAIAAWSFVVQFASVALWYTLEAAQNPDLWDTRSRLLLRFVNIVAVASGNLEAWGLRPPMVDRVAEWNFFPFVARHYVPDFPFGPALVVWSLAGLVALLAFGKLVAMRRGLEDAAPSD